MRAEQLITHTTTVLPEAPLGTHSTFAHVGDPIYPSRHLASSVQFPFNKFGDSRRMSCMCSSDCSDCMNTF